MNEPGIIFDHVAKKFSRGYTSDSMRDAIVRPFKRLFGRDGFQSAKPDAEFWALKDVSFNVRPGEVLGIIGPNGSGKSTSLKLISRILRPDKGRIVVKGRVGAMIELGAGFNHDLTGKENVFLNGSILGMSMREIQKRYEEIVEFAELHDFMDTPVKWYSSGMLARLGFAVAAHIEPQVLLVDEVLSVGDLGFQQKCLDKMRSFRSLGMPIIFISHNLQHIAALCNRIILLNNGHIEKQGKAEEVITHYIRGFSQTKSNSSESVLVEKGALYNEDGIECTSFTPGNTAIYEVSLRFNRSFSDIYVSAFISTQDGIYAFHTDSSRMGSKPLTVSKGQSVVFSIKMDLNLTSGEYGLGTNVYDRRTGKRIFQKVFTDFVIQKDARGAGIAFMDPQLIEIKII